MFDQQHAIESWEDVSRCGCALCQQLQTIADRCDALGEFLYVVDLRPFGHGFTIVDKRRVFRTNAHIRRGIRTPKKAVEMVLTEFGQKHCDLWLSSWPCVYGELGGLWTVELTGEV